MITTDFLKICMPPSIFFSKIISCVTPVAVLKKKKSLVLYDVVADTSNLVIYDPA